MTGIVFERGRALSEPPPGASERAARRDRRKGEALLLWGYDANGAKNVKVANDEGPNRARSAEGTALGPLLEGHHANGANGASDANGANGANDQRAVGTASS
jgi:hypothetical protein